MTDKSHRTVINSHTRSYDDPVVVQAGERVRITKHEVWDDRHVWLWCIAATGKQGWVPETYLEYDGEHGTCLREYSARELTVAAGDAVTNHGERSASSGKSQDYQEKDITNDILLSCSLKRYGLM